MARIGIFSGTFDPVHYGHITFCQAALATAKLNKVVLLPEAEPRDKQQVTPLQHRLAMLQLATRQLPALEIMSLAGKQFDVAHTLPELVGRFPDDELVLLVGSDVVKTFAYRWPGLETLLQTMELVIGVREGADAEDVAQTMQRLQHEYSKVSVRYQCVSANPYAHGASSRVRAAVQGTSETIPHIAAYIAEHRLYAPSSIS